jgi:hypothetical protein
VFLLIFPSFAPARYAVRVPGPDPRRSGNPARRAAAASAVKRGGVRASISGPSRAVLTVMSRLPLWVIPAVMLVLMVVGLSAPLPYSVPALLVVGVFICWLAYLAWPVLPVRARMLRGVMIALWVGAVTARLIGAL